MNHCLVIGGGRAGWTTQSMLHRELHLEDNVALPGFVDDADLPALYSRADVFAFPSLYEGFAFHPRRWPAARRW